MAGATEACVRREQLDDGQIVRLVLDSPPGNVLDGATLAALEAGFEALGPRVKAVLLAAEGKHFCFGASVEEHLPDKVAHMLHTFNGLFARMAAASVPVVCAVQGMCLGGGLELASWCQRVVAAPNAKLGQAEIVLGVFAPAASAILPERIGQAAADDLLLTGRNVGADEALALGLVDAVADDPQQAALAWIREHLLPRSAASLRFATRAARAGFQRRFEARVEELTAVYLDELMATHDAVEGITAFLEKRAPTWRDA